jgi:ligand-binding SRPBCC domain-containing protein
VLFLFLSFLVSASFVSAVSLPHPLYTKPDSMRLTIHTSVEKPYQEVFAGFTFELFKQLTPTNPPVTIKRFDGCKKGDEVHLEMTVPVLNRKEMWVSRIIASGTVIGNATFTDEMYFIDQGIELPFFLTSWRHKHRIIKAEDGGAVIVDDIEYTTPLWLLLFVAPVISKQFRDRQPVYQEYFKKRAGENNG